MISLSYNLSPALRENIRKIDHLRQRILLSPLPRESEIELKWEMRLDKIYWSLALEDKSITKKEIALLLKPGGPASSLKKSQEEEALALRLNSSHNYLLKNWFVTPKQPTAKDVADLYKMLSGLSVNISTDSFGKTLEYLKAVPEHPIIPAAIIHLEALSLPRELPARNSLASLLSYLFLYKFGYDVKEFIVLEESLKKDLMMYTKNVETLLDGGNLTLWLEYFSGIFIWALERSLREISNPRPPTNHALSLNDRQIEVLSLLENPDAVISNKKLQNLFKISQITASRDLSELASLGLIFPRGKGRSTIYSKI